MKKVLCCLFIAGILSFSFAQEPAKASSAAVADTTQKVSLTIEELAKYNGKDGNPAYVAVDGVIYDVTGVDSWKRGKHEGYGAGQDITKFISKSPHKNSVLKKRKVVGTIKASEKK